MSLDDLFSGDARLTDSTVEGRRNNLIVVEPDALLDREGYEDPYDERGRAGRNWALILVCGVILVLGVGAAVVLIQAWLNLVAWEPVIAERCP
jgi:hypothetical protein